MLGAENLKALPLCGSRRGVGRCGALQVRSLDPVVQVSPRSARGLTGVSRGTARVSSRKEQHPHRGGRLASVSHTRCSIGRAQDPGHPGIHAHRDELGKRKTKAYGWIASKHAYPPGWPNQSLPSPFLTSWLVGVDFAHERVDLFLRELFKALLDHSVLIVTQLLGICHVLVRDAEDITCRPNDCG